MKVIEGVYSQATPRPYVPQQSAPGLRRLRISVGIQDPSWDLRGSEKKMDGECTQTGDRANNKIGPRNK